MTKREHRPAGYDATVDRRRPAPLGCIKVVPIVFGLVAALVCALTAFSFSAPQQPVPTLDGLPSLTPTLSATPSQTPDATLTATSTLTPDAWSMTGTALAEATISPTPTPTTTLDYCWWLTPTATATPTALATPDAWGLAGTATWEADHPQQQPTVAPPRELCREWATWTPEATYELIFVTQTPGPESTVTITGPVALGRGAAEAPATLRSNVTVTGGRVEQVVVTSAPQIVVQTAAPPPPQVVIQTQVVIATSAPTVTRDADYYASATAYFGTVGPIWTATMDALWTRIAQTLTPPATASATIADAVTDEPETTLEASATLLATETTSPSPTGSETPTEPPTATATPTPTWTLEPTQTSEPTATDVPTEAPTDEPPEESSEDA